MSAGDRTLHSLVLNVKIVCHVWDSALWEVSDQICMMTRESVGMKGRKRDTNIGSTDGFKSLRLRSVLPVV